jgi:hypothetical protein
MKQLLSNFVAVLKSFSNLVVDKDLRLECLGLYRVVLQK